MTNKLLLGIKHPDVCQYGSCTNKRTIFYYGCYKHNQLNLADIKSRIEEKL